MATNKQTFQMTRNFQKDVVFLDGYISIAADASVVAPATAAVAGKGGLKEPTAGTTWCDGGTVAKNGTGIYEVTLAGKYLRLLSCSSIVCSSTNAAFDVQMTSNNINASTALGSQKLIFKVVATNSSNGAAVDPNVVMGIRFTARLKNG